MKKFYSVICSITYPTTVVTYLELKVHLAHSRYNADGWVHQVANLLDVVVLLSAHLDDEYLMIGTQLLSYGAYHTKQGVEIAGGDKYVVFLGKHACKVVLCTGLSEAACYADDDEPLMAVDDAFGIVVVMAVYGRHRGKVRQLLYEDRQKHSWQHGRCGRMCE